MSEPLVEGEKKRFFDKLFFISLAISTGCLLVTSTLIFLIEYFLWQQGPKDGVSLAMDAIGITGFFGILIYLMSFVSSKGTFDILEYGLKIAVFTVFKPNYRKNNFPKTFYDYKMQKDSKGRNPIRGLLFVSLLFLAVGAILLAIHMTAQ
ncbi:MAG: DUF3899 domain-containing protein [Bacilli bacterium]|nr:DUF3899 domain-containing protein [Bacilli bacterium]